MKNHSGNKNPNYKDGRSHAKRVTLRLSKERHDQTVWLAASWDCSLNDAVLKAIGNEFERQTAVKDGE